MRIFHRTKSLYYYSLIKETYLGQQRLPGGGYWGLDPIASNSMGTDPPLYAHVSAAIVWIKMIPHAISNIHGNKTSIFEQTLCCISSK